MTHPPYIREKARQMRVEKDLTIDEIAERLGISRQTIAYWVRDLPLRERRCSPGQALGTAAMQLKYARLREEAYRCGWDEFDALSLEPTFRDFVCMYIGEGYKRSRNVVSLCNSNPSVVVLGKLWICRFAANKLDYRLQHHADQDPVELCESWSRVLNIEPTTIQIQRKSNSNQLAGRTWRSLHGVMAVSTNDTCFRARLQAWIDRVSAQWLDLPRLGA